MRGAASWLSLARGPGSAAGLGRLARVLPADTHVPSQSSPCSPWCGTRSRCLACRKNCLHVLAGLAILCARRALCIPAAFCMSAHAGQGVAPVFGQARFHGRTRQQSVSRQFFCKFIFVFVIC